MTINSKSRQASHKKKNGEKLNMWYELPDIIKIINMYIIPSPLLILPHSTLISFRKHYHFEIAKSVTKAENKFHLHRRKTLIALNWVYWRGKEEEGGKYFSFCSCGKAFYHKVVCSGSASSEAKSEKESYYI